MSNEQLQITVQPIERKVNEIIPDGWKATTQGDRDFCDALINQLVFALELEPGAPVNALYAEAVATKEITCERDRENIADQRKQIVLAMKNIKECFRPACERWHALHKSAIAAESVYYVKMEASLAHYNLLISKDLEQQRQAAERERKRLQWEADERAKEEQRQRELEAAKEVAIQRAARLKAEQDAANARGKAAKARAEQEAIEAKERERQSKLAAEETARNKVQAAIVEAPQVQKVSGTIEVMGKYKARVINLDLVPEQYLMPKEADMVALHNEAKKRKLELRIPGVEVYFEPGTVKTKG